MPTIISCKHCGVQIEHNGVLWIQIDALIFPQYCGCSNQLHEPFTPEEEPNSSWKKQMEDLLFELKKGDEGAVDLLGSDMFITTDGKPHRSAINEFSKFAPCKIYPGEQDSCGWLTGIIEYAGKKFMFG